MNVIIRPAAIFFFTILGSALGTPMRDGLGKRGVFDVDFSIKVCAYPGLTSYQGCVTGFADCCSKCCKRVDEFPTTTSVDGVTFAMANSACCHVPPPPDKSPAPTPAPAPAPLAPAPMVVTPASPPPVAYVPTGQPVLYTTGQPTYLVAAPAGPVTPPHA